MRRAIRDRPTGASLPGRADPSGRPYTPRRCVGKPVDTHFLDALGVTHPAVLVPRVARLVASLPNAGRPMPPNRRRTVGVYGRLRTGAGRGKLRGGAGAVYA
jgi:hypothetical protein